MITSQHNASLTCHKLLTVSLLEINGTVSLSLPWLPEAFHARFRPKTCRPAADEVPCRTREKPLVPKLTLSSAGSFFLSAGTQVPQAQE